MFRPARTRKRLARKSNDSFIHSKRRRRACIASRQHTASGDSICWIAVSDGTSNPRRSTNRGPGAFVSSSHT